MPSVARNLSWSAFEELQLPGTVRMAAMQQTELLVCLDQFIALLLLSCCVINPVMLYWSVLRTAWEPVSKLLQAVVPNQEALVPNQQAVVMRCSTCHTPVPSL